MFLGCGRSGLEVGSQVETSLILLISIKVFLLIISKLLSKYRPLITMLFFTIIQ